MTVSTSLAAKSWGIRGITPEEFQRFQQLIHRAAGIRLGENKEALLVGRLGRRLRELGLESYGAYYQYVINDAGPELVRMLDLITTNETRFFREPQHFEFLRAQVFPKWVQRAEHTGDRSIRVWSAGCSTGQEPYTLAMVLRESFPREEGWDIDILATDLSTRVLEVARQATWPIEKALEIPAHSLKRFMLRGTGSQEGKMRAGPELRSLIRFARLNLNEPFPWKEAPFQLILCRNVLIYFSQEAKERAIQQLLGQLAPTGHLILGRSEMLGPNYPVRTLTPSVYVHATRTGQRPTAPWEDAT